MNGLIKNVGIKNNNKIGIDYNNRTNEQSKAHNQVYSKNKEYEIKKIKRKKLSYTNNNFNLNKNNNYIIFRHNTFNKLKEREIEKEKKENNQLCQNSKIDHDLSKEINTLSFYYMNNINTNKNKNSSKQKNIQNLNKGSTSRKESKKISKNLSRENMRVGGNNFLQGGTQRKNISNKNDENNNKKILKLYDYNIMNNNDFTLINNTNDIIFTTKNKNMKEKKHSLNNVLLNSGNKFKGEKKFSLVDKFTKNLEYNKQHNQIKIDINNINNIIPKKENIPICKVQSNDKKKNLKNLTNNHSKENIVKNIKNIIIENSNKNNIELINHLKNEANIYSTNNTNTNNINTNNKKMKDSNMINQQIKKIDFKDYTNKKVQNLTISSMQNKLDIKQNNNEVNYRLYNLNNKKILKYKNKDKLLTNINKNVNNLINNNGINANSTQNNINIYITYINNTSSSNSEFQKIKSNTNYLLNINKSNTNITDKLKNSSKKSINSINNITKLNTLQNEDIKKRLKYNNYKSKINYSSPKMPSLYERYNDKPHLRRPLSNNQNIKNNDKTYSPKLNSIAKYIQTESNNSNINLKNTNLFINRLEFYENYSISSRKDNIFSKINNNFKNNNNNNNYINILNKRKLSAKIKNEKGISLLKLIENKDRIKEKESINLTKRRPRKIENEVNNLFTEISNVCNNNKNSFFNFGIIKININSNNGINTTKLLDNFKNNNNKEKNRKYSFINILKPKAISQQKRHSDKKENNQEKSKMVKDTKSLTFISKDNKKKNISLLRKKRIIRLIHMMDEFNNSKSKSRRKNKSYNNINNRGISAVKERKKIDKFNINYLKNDIIMFTIYILSKYHGNCKKIGLNKIKLYDKNNNEIFIVDSNSNINNNFEENVDYLFNNKKNSYNKPFISDFKDNLHINFYINIKKSNVIKFLKIINYENKEENISPIKEIKLCYGKKILFQGTLNVNYFNIINISENKSLFENKDFPIYSTSKKRENSANINNSNSSINNIYSSNYKRNNTRSFSTFRASSGKKNNKIPKKQLIKINSERNISNKNYESNNINNFKCMNYNNTEIEGNNYTTKNSKTNICNTIPYNNKNDSENILYMRERFISDNSIRKETNLNDTNVNDNDFHKGIIIHKFNLNNYNKINDTNYFEKEQNNNLSYIKFKRIRLVLSSNYGHPNFIGLTGLEFYDSNNKLIDIETAETIGALPKDLHTIYNIENDNRIFENIFNGENNVDDSYNMWVTLFDTSKEFPYIELSFNAFIYLSKIRIFNYNKKNELDICVRTIEIFLDNKYYNTIYLHQGIGYISNENIIQKDNLIINNNETKNFSQEFYLPINNNYYNHINKTKISSEKKINIEYASNKFEQSYETPYMPNGHIIKFQLLSNYYKGKPIDNNEKNTNTNSVNNILVKNYNYIGINIVNVFDENGNDILSQKDNKYKIISNKEMIIYDKNTIILKSSQNEDNDNNIFLLFENPINISFIELNPFYFINNENTLNSVKEIKIFCDSSIIFEGEVYNYQPTIILFTSNPNISENININYLTKKRLKRQINEINKEDYFSLVFNT